MGKPMSYEDLSANIGKVISETRKKKNMTQDELSVASQISKATITNLESNKGNVTISLRLLFQILTALDLDILYFFLQVLSTDDSAEYEVDEETISHTEKTLNTMYPINYTNFKVSTLLSFLAYLPLISQHEIVDMLSRINGDLIENENYVLQLINRTINEIPSTLAKEYADRLTDSISNVRQCYSSTRQFRFPNTYKIEDDQKAYIDHIRTIQDRYFKHSDLFKE